MPARRTAATYLVCLSLFALISSLVARTVAGQTTYNAGLSMAVRAERGHTRPGQPLLLAVTVTNDSGWAATIDLDCDPPYDLQIRDASGAMVWRAHPTCVPARSKVQLAAGARREWTTAWPARDVAGAPMARGVYTVWGTVATVPVGSVVGPLVIEVGGEAVEATQAPERSPTPREHPAGTRTPAEHPEPTVTPVATSESSTAFPITDAGGRQREPDVAGNPSLGECQNLGVWWDEDAGRIQGRWIGQGWRSEPFAVSGEAPALGAPAVAYNREAARWLVVWSGHSSEHGREVLARRLRCGALDGAPFAVGSGAGDDDQPAVAAFGESFGVVWRHTTEEGSLIHGAQVIGDQVRHRVAISPPGRAYEPAVACEPGEPCLVVWTRADGDQRDVVGRYWFPHEEGYVGESILPIAVAEVRERSAALAWNGEADSYLVAWTYEGDDALVVQARAVYPASPRHLDDYLLGPAVDVSPHGRYADQPDVAQLGLDFAVVWAEGEGAPDDVGGRRVSLPRESHLPLLHPAVIVSDADAVESHPAVAAARDPLGLVVWDIAWPSGDVDILGRHIAFPRGGSGALVVLVGLVTDREDVDGFGRWTMSVLQSRGAPMPCAVAEVYYDRNMRAAPPSGAGELVGVSGLALQSPYRCSLVAETTDVAGGRLLVDRTFFPAGHR